MWTYLSTWLFLELLLLRLGFRLETKGGRKSRVKEVAAFLHRTKRDKNPSFVGKRK
jgi:hypothetical protein